MRIVDVLPITAAGRDADLAGRRSPLHRRVGRRPRCGSSSCRPSWARGRAWRLRDRGGRCSVPDLRDGHPVPDVRAAGAGRRAGRGVHLPAAPRRRTSSVRSTCTATTPGALDAEAHGGRADPGRRGGRLPAQRPGARRPARTRPSSCRRELAARRADRAAEPDPAAASGSSTRSSGAAGRRRRWRSCSPTSTGSSRSTTPTATTSATSCWSPSANRLTGLLRPGDTLARLAGDEFVILCEDLDEPSQVEPLAARIGTAFAEPFVLVESPMSSDRQRRHRLRRAGRATCPSRSSRTPTPRCTRPSARAAAGTRIIDLRERTSAERPGADLQRDLPRRARPAASCASTYQPIVATADGRSHRRRGAAALGAPDPRDRVGRTDGHPARRAVRADHRDRTVGARAGLPGPHGVAAAPRARPARRRGQRVGPPADGAATSPTVAAVLADTGTEPRRW